MFICPVSISRGNYYFNGESFAKIANHHHTGKEGEMLAATWLEEQGWLIIEKNWRAFRYEIDIIASRDQILHFIEVKTRRSLSFGHPEESVNDKKMDSLMRCAEIYMERKKGWKQIQFDVLSITILAGKPVEYFLIEDVYL